MNSLLNNYEFRNPQKPEWRWIHWAKFLILRCFLRNLHFFRILWLILQVIDDMYNYFRKNTNWCCYGCSFLLNASSADSILTRGINSWIEVPTSYGYPPFFYATKGCILLMNVQNMKEVFLIIQNRHPTDNITVRAAKCYWICCHQASRDCNVISSCKKVFTE